MWTFKGQSAFLASELGFLGQPDTYVFWKSFLDQRRHFLNILALNSGATGCKKYANRFIALIFYALSAVIIKNFTKWSMRGRWIVLRVSGLSKKWRLKLSKKWRWKIKSQWFAKFYYKRTINRYRRKRLKVVASIFDSGWVILVARTRRKKEKKIACPLLDVFACGLVSSPRVYRLRTKYKDYQTLT